VVIYDPALDLLTTARMLGRAGRDGSPSHAFFVTGGTAVSSSKPSQSDQLPKEPSEVVHKKVCKVYRLMCHLDGEDFRKTCAEIPGQLSCGICGPNSPMHQFAMRAVQNPHRPNRKLQACNPIEPSHKGHRVNPPSPGP